MELQQTSEPKRKRTKIGIACDTCRARKVRCDGAKPCVNCAKKTDIRSSCRYSQNAPSEKQATADEHPPAPMRNPAMDQQVIGHQAIRPTLPAGASSTNSSPVNQRSFHVSTPAADSMTAVADQGSKTSEHFGNSSAGSFTAQIRRAIDLRMGHTEAISQTQSSLAHTMPPTIPQYAHMSSEEHRMLPTRRQADHLLNLYWTYVDPLYPFLERSRFMSAYRNIFEGSPIDYQEDIFLAIINTIFALSNQLIENSTSQQREQSSDSYFYRAQSLTPLNTWDGASIELIQYLLLASQYLQSTDHPHQTWMVVSSAVRIAQGLGLHLPETSAGQLDHTQTDLLRRVWYGCVLMDRMVAVTHGRPASVASHISTAVPKPFHDTETGSVSANPDTDVSFFVKSVELYEIIYRTVVMVYAAGPTRHPSTEDIQAASKSASPSDEPQGGDPDICVVLQLDRNLDTWELSLPARLRYESSVSCDQITRRQAVILRLRFLHARVLLLRPVMGRSTLTQPDITTPNRQSLGDCVTVQCSLLCVKVAKDIVATLQDHQPVDETIGLLPAWWYRVYYVYTAATILIAAKLRPDIHSTRDLNVTWSRAMSVLKAHEKFGRSAQRCVAALHFLSSKMLDDVSGTRETTTMIPDVFNGNDELEVGNFLFDMGGFTQPGQQDAEFDMNDLSWLNDMHATWDILNHG